MRLRLRLLLLVRFLFNRPISLEIKVKASSLDIAPLTILNSCALQPRKWQLTGNDCSYRGAGSDSPEPALNGLLGPQLQPAGILRPSQPRQIFTP